MSVSLAGPDGRVVGGGLAGLLVAAGPVQVQSFPNFIVLIYLKWDFFIYFCFDVK